MAYTEVSSKFGIDFTERSLFASIVDAFELRDVITIEYFEVDSVAVEQAI